MEKLIFVFVSLLPVFACQARTITVDDDGPADFDNIQAAIDDANSGDTVIVILGRYPGIDFKGKGITVKSETGPEECIIADNDAKAVIYFQSGEGNDSILEGFTITGNHWRGGIYIKNSCPVIKNCLIVNNGSDFGGGITCVDSCPTVINCTIANNDAQYGGGAVAYARSSGYLVNCAIIKNVSYFSNEGGLSFSGGSPHIINCTIVGNTGSGIYCSGSNPSIINCVIWDNVLHNCPQPTYSCWPNGREGTGNISSYPQFVDPAAGDYRLLPYSPCVDTGTNTHASGETDLVGNPRLIDGDRYGAAIVDMGAYETPIVEEPVIDVSETTVDIIVDANNMFPEDREITIHNRGGNILDWAIAYNCSWLEVFPTAGQSSGQQTEISLSINTEGLLPRIYTCELTVSAPNALNTPETVEVNLTIMGPVIELSATDFDFHAKEDGPNPSGQILTIRNSGEGTLDWTIIEDCSWLEASPTGGSSSGETDEVTLSVVSSGLDRGQYTCDIMISDPLSMNSPQIVRISLVVQGPVMELSSTRFHFFWHDGINLKDQKLSIHNAGGGVLNWAITYDCNWLDVSPTSGSSSGEPNEVILSVDVTDLEARVYECELTVSDPEAENSPQIVQVMLAPTTVITVDDDGQADFNNIQAAIDQTNDWDTVIVADGTYTGEGNYNIDFKGKPITVRSRNGPARTVVDCEGVGTGFAFGNNLDAYSVLDGFTIKNGYFPQGGGIICYEGSPTIRNCIISGNRASHYGGAMFIYASSPILINCTIVDNIALGSVNPHHGGIAGGSPILTNCIVWGNWAPGTPGVEEDQIDGDNPVINYCCIEGWSGALGGTGNFGADPFFVEQGYWDHVYGYGPVYYPGDYHLLTDSPCLNAGDPNFVPTLDAKDADGEPRVMGDRVDIGADEVGPNQADLTRNGIINFEDLAVFARSWQAEPLDDNWYILSDLYEDGLINFIDFAVIANDWLWQASWYTP
jgi:hypothetical protein